jgi:predicted NBD/HSP70 family sugar kinase
MLTLNADLAILVADVRPSQAILAVVDLNGRFLGRAIVPLINDPKQGVNAMIAGMESLRSSFPNTIFEGIGISLPGRVDKKTRRLLLAPNLGWTNFDIRQPIEDRMGLKVELDNAANACLLSELWFGHMEDLRDAVLITISEGVGTAILSNGQLIEGSSGLAGEFGHIPIDPSGPQCGCLAHGCWEMFASSRAALRFYSEQAPDGRATTIQELINLEANGDQAAIAAIEKQARFIGLGLRMITASLNPQVILFAGDITTCWRRSGPLVEEEVSRSLLAGDAPKLVPIGDGELARLRGAAALVLQKHAGYKRLQPDGRASADHQATKSLQMPRPGGAAEVEVR